MQRYAIYFSPDLHSPWWQAGNQWLGRDPAAMQALTQPVLPGMTPQIQHQLTSQARRYGFHATLKAPFRLQENVQVSELNAALILLSQQQTALTIPIPRVQWMGSFLALCPSVESAEIQHFAMQCVRALDHFRAPLNASELARRQPDQLSERQRELLSRWGYPYTEEEFRFHLTLSDQIKDQTQALAIYQAATTFFQISDPLRIESLALFCEPQPGADFQLIARYPLRSISLAPILA